MSAASARWTPPRQGVRRPTSGRPPEPRRGADRGPASRQRVRTSSSPAPPGGAARGRASVRAAGPAGSPGCARAPGPAQIRVSAPSPCHQARLARTVSAGAACVVGYRPDQPHRARRAAGGRRHDAPPRPRAVGARPASARCSGRASTRSGGRESRGRGPGQSQATGRRAARGRPGCRRARRPRSDEILDVRAPPPRRRRPTSVSASSATGWPRLPRSDRPGPPSCAPHPLGEGGIYSAPGRRSPTVPVSGATSRPTYSATAGVGRLRNRRTLGRAAAVGAVDGEPASVADDESCRARRGRPRSPADARRRGRAGSTLQPSRSRRAGRLRVGRGAGVPTSTRPASSASCGWWQVDPLDHPDAARPCRASSTDRVLRVVAELVGQDGDDVCGASQSDLVHGANRGAARRSRRAPAQALWTRLPSRAHVDDQRAPSAAPQRPAHRPDEACESA